MYRGRQAAVNAKNVVVDDYAERQKVKHVGEVMPHVGIAIFATALGVEAVGLGDATRFVVAADEVYARWIAQLEADEQGDGFDAEEAAVNVVACGSFESAYVALQLSRAKVRS